MDSNPLKCTQCGATNRHQARFCSACGTALQPAAKPASDADQPPASTRPGGLKPKSVLASLAKRAYKTAERLPKPGHSEEAPTPAHPGTRKGAKQHPEIIEGRSGSLPRQDKEEGEREEVTLSPPLFITPSPQHAGTRDQGQGASQKVIVYATSGPCPNCGAISPNYMFAPVCQNCGSPIPVKPVRVLVQYPHGLTSKQEQIVAMQLEHPALVPIRETGKKKRGTYVLYKYVPGQPLTSLAVPLSHEQAVLWTAQLADLATYLHGKGIAAFRKDNSLNRLIATEEGLVLAEVLASDLLPPEGWKRAELIATDLHFVVRVMSFLLTGKDPEKARGVVPGLTDAARAIISRATNEMYGSAQDLLRDLRRLLPEAEGLGPRVVIGKRTDTGQERELNEDTVHVGQIATGATGRPAYLCLVADGMGGHAAGEVASRAAVDTIAQELSARLRQVATTQEVGAIADEALKWAVERANQAVWEKGQAQGSDMGTTLVAALVIHNIAYIANVGDSRAYLFRQGGLEQITSDHSLVARLVAVGQLTPDEIYTHPQRNEIFRFLGHGPTVEVDLFVRTLEPGDQLLLCSDGLWEMVRDPAIRDALATGSDPQATCEALVRQANANGGEDNISVVVLWSVGQAPG